MDFEKRLNEKMKLNLKYELIDGETKSSLYTMRTATSVKGGLSVAF